MANFDLSALALSAVCPGNEILYDDKGMPSIMVKIPKQTYAQLGLGDSTEVHPAFMVNGKEVDAIYISKYQNIMQNNRAYSLPAQDPCVNVNFDTARQYCENKGDGWHLMTRAEWALLALWCKQNGCMPKGNNNYGKDTSEAGYKALPTSLDSGKTGRVATGTGPLSWSHDGTPSGIWDLNGNVYEWVGGLRTVYGEIQVLANNNAADSAHSQSASSAEWKAIDATTGEYITPDGNGTTANSVKADYISSKWVYSTAITNQVDNYQGCTFGSATCDNTISDAAKKLLYALALLPYDATAANYGGDYLYINNGNPERSFRCGGSWSNGAYAGVFGLRGSHGRSSADTLIGFRSAFVKLPTG